MEELTELLSRLRQEEGISENAYAELLNFANNNQALQLQQTGVSGQSEQLPCCDCENYAEWDNGIRWCSVCGTKLS